MDGNGKLSTEARDLFVASGICPDHGPVPEHLRLYARQVDEQLAKVRRRVREGEMNLARAIEFQELLVEAGKQVINHPIIANNLYLRRFAEGVTLAQARHELTQFSIFAIKFDVAQAELVTNAATLEAYEERLKVLLNEKGIPYKKGFAGDLTGRWSAKNVHFTWLLKMGEGLGLSFQDLGKIWHATAGTRRFVEATFKFYSSTDSSTQSGSSFAVEGWAANYLWGPWISSMKKLNEVLSRKVNIGYLTYHDKEEAHHSQATLDELLENFEQPWFDRDRFLRGAKGILDEGVTCYYIGQLATLPEKDSTWPVSACAPVGPRSKPSPEGVAA